MTEDLKREIFALPVLSLRDVIVYPHMVIPLFVGRKASIVALERAMESDKRIVLVAQKDPSVDNPKENLVLIDSTFYFSSENSRIFSQAKFKRQ